MNELDYQHKCALHLYLGHHSLQGLMSGCQS